MSDERIPSDAVRHLRHELRTPINHVLGFGDLLRDDAADAGHDDVVADLTRIHTAGEEALAVIGDFLSADALSADDLRSPELYDRLRGPVDQITAACAAVRQAAATLDLPDMIPDLDVIDEAACHLLALAADLPALIGHGHDEDGLPNDGHAGHHAQHYDAEIAVAPPTAARAGSAQERTYRLLVVDDNAANREVLTRSLERLGYAVSQAVNGRQALEMAATARFDLLLLDIMMPDVDGYQVLEQLKTDETLRDIPVIVISALHEMSSVTRCIAMGAEDYLPKPFDAVLLRARIGACLDKKRLRDLEVEYLRQVAHVTSAAAAVEVGAFDPASLATVAERPDGLGQLARIFQRMAREVDARERRLKEQVHELQIAIDRTREARQVAEITETDYFRDLQAKARRLRDRTASTGGDPGAEGPG